MRNIRAPKYTMAERAEFVKPQKRTVSAVIILLSMSFITGVLFAVGLHSIR